MRLDRSGFVLSVFFISSFTALPVFAAKLANKDFFDQPISQNKTFLGKSRDADGPVSSTCWKYNDFAVVQVIDPALVGAKEINLRHSKNNEELCAAKYKSPSISLNEPMGAYYYQGAVANYLFFEGADSFGNQVGLLIVSSLDGKTILKETRDAGHSMFIAKNRDLAQSLRFHKTLKVKCPLAKEGPKCWEKIKTENEVPHTVKIAAPDCKDSFTKLRSPFENTALVSVPVVIEKLSEPKITYLDGQASCEPAP